MSLSNLKLMLWNCRSVRNKMFELFNFLNTNEIDICLLCETWLSEANKLYHPQYHCLRRDRVGQSGGGVAILVRKSVKFTALPHIGTEVIENIGIEINVRDNVNLKIYSIYFPGGQNNSLLRRKFKQDIRKLFNTEDKFLIGGDLNSRHRYWNCLRANSWGNILHDSTSIFPVTISYSNTPTYIPASSRQNPSTLDLVISNIPEYLSNPYTLTDLTSDHLPVLFTLSTTAPLVENLVYYFNRADWKKFKHILINSFRNVGFPNQNTGSLQDIDNYVEYFTCTTLNAFDSSVPKGPPKNNIVKFPAVILNLIKIRNRYSRDWSRYRQYSDYTFMLEYNKIVQTLISLFRNGEWNRRLRNMRKGSKPFWNVSKILRKRTGQCHSLLHEDEVIISDQGKCDAFADTFSQNFRVSEGLGQVENSSMVDNAVLQFDDINVVTPITDLVSVDDVKSIIKYTNKKRASGLDNISNLMLHMLPSVAIAYLTAIYNACLLLQYFPSAWKKAKVIAVHKPGKPLNTPDSYRPISLISNLSKILEKILSMRITNFIEDNNILPDEQFGFRKAHSTVHQVKRICNVVKIGLNMKSSTGLVLLDVEKAFDSMWHNGLIFKLLKFNLPFHIIKIIKNFLSDRYFTVSFGSASSEQRAIPAGVPQGSVLGPILYNIFSADIPDISPCQFAAYADDLGIFYTHELSQNILTELQCSLNTLEDYYSKWKVKINPSKSQAIFFSRKRKLCHLPSANLTILGNNINWLDSVHYLGITLDKKLIFKQHVSYIIEKVDKYRKILYPLINRNSLLSNENKLLIIKIIFQSIILYGCPIWGSCAKTHVKKLQISQNKLLKMALKLPWHFSTDRLHNISNTKLVQNCIQCITDKFKTNSSFSNNPLIASLY